MAVMEASGRTGTVGEARRRRAARKTAISSAGRWFHLFGALAMIVGMFLPLTDVGRALASPDSYENPALARQQEEPTTTAFTQVAAVGDFQGQFGCNGFDISCPSTQLTNHDGLWTGSFTIPPGTWQWQIIAMTQDGQQFAFDASGLSVQPASITVGEGDAGAYFAFDAASQDADAVPLPAIFQLSTDVGTYAMAFENGTYTAIVQAPFATVIAAEAQINGVASGIPLSIPVEQGPNAVTLDPAGSLLDAESLGYATLTVTRIDEATGQPIGGGCYEVARNGETISRGCDTDDGMADGSVTLSFPAGIEPGTVTVIEASIPDGAETAPDQDVDLQPGDNVVEIRTGDAVVEEPTEDITTEEPTEDPSGEIVDIPVDDPEVEPTATTPDEPVEEPTAAPIPGDLYVTLQADNGQPIGGACFELVDEDGNVVDESCDTDDAVPFNGVVGFTGIPEGDYTIRQSTTPENTSPAPDQPVTVVGGIENFATVTGSFAEPTPEPVGDITVLRGDDQGGVAGGACFQLFDVNGNPVDEPVCDEDGDFPDDGRIGFFDITAGDYTLRETRTPEGVEPAADTPVTVMADTVVEISVQSPRIVEEIATEEPTAEPTAEPTTEPTLEPTATTGPEADVTEDAIPGSLIITLHDQNGQPIGGACFELRQGDTVIGPICDTQDDFPNNGNTGFFGYPSGTYTLHQTSAPEGTQPVPDQDVEIPAGEQATVIVVAPAPEATEEPTAEPTDEAADEPDLVGPASVQQGTGSLIVDLTGFDLGGQTVCVELNTAGLIGFISAPGACDDGEGDVNLEAGIIRIDGIAPDTYMLSFTDGPDDLVNAEPREVTILEGEVTTLTLPDTAPQQDAEPGTINVVFQIADGTRVEVEGGCATLDSIGTSICDNGGGDNDTAAGVISFANLDEGDYNLTIDAAPAGYSLGETTFPVSLAAGATETVPVTISRTTTTAIVRTVDVADNSVLLPGACYTLDGASETCDDADGANDGIVTFTGVVPGERMVAQTVAPANYEQVTETQTLMVAADGTTEFLFQNTAQVGSIEITTRVAGGGDILTGACYAVDGGTPVCDAEDGADDGIVTINNVRVGPHTITQSTPPTGYELAAAMADFNVVSGLNQVTVENFPLTGSIVTEIVDEAGNPFGGACVTIEGVGDRCDGGTEDAAADQVGVIRTNGVSLGEHDVTVATVPAGYDIPSDVQVANVTVETPATVRFTILETPPAVGDLNVRVQFADNQELIPGVCVTVTSTVEGIEPVSACDSVEGDTNDEAGVIGFSDLQVGTYLVSLQEGTTIDGGDVAGTIPVSVDILAGGGDAVEIEAAVASTATLEVPRVPTTGNLRITTTDGAATIAGAAYRITGDGYDVTVTDDDDTDVDTTAGIIQVNGLAPGAYTITMTTTPAGYNTAVVPDADVLVGDTLEVEVVLAAIPDPGSLVVRTTNASNEPLADACYGLNQNGSRVADACDADDGASDGTTSFADLDAGSYQLVQTRSPGQQYTAFPGLTVTIEAGEETVVDVRMTEQPGRLVVITVDTADTSLRLDNACYQLTGATTFGPFCDADDGTVDGRVIFTNVPAGAYTLTETVAPTGFEAAGDRTVTIPAGRSLQVTVGNARIPLPEVTGTLVVIPLSPDGSEVAGGCYQVFDGDTPLTDRVCDNADDQPRRITFSDLPVGEYTVVERLAPSPDYIIASPMTVTIEENTTTELRVQHQLKPGRLLIQAVNSTGLPLQGACFNISDDGQDPYCTTATGEILVNDLAAGTWTVTQTQAPYGYRLNEAPREIRVHPGQTTVLRVVFEVEPPPNTGTVQVQKFVCPAGDEGERTLFLGGAQGNAQLKQTVGCVPAVAEFELEPENGSSGNFREFATTAEGRYQVTVEEGIYVLTETNPDLPGNSAARLRVGVGQMTTVIVINYIAPPQPEPATINVEGYTCPPSFNGTTYEDFAANCINDTSPTNQITVRAEGESRFKQVTGDGGVVGVTTFEDLPAGTYNIYAEKPFSVPLMYMFCGGNADYPADYKVINGTVRTDLGNGETMNCEIFLIPEQMSAETGAILVQKYSCPIEAPMKGYDFQGECSRSAEQVVFEIAVFNGEMQEFEPLTRVTANPDGIVRFPNLRPGTYKLTEVDGQWCFAQSNSVNADGNVVVQANKLSEVWVYNCVGTQEPPNTGSGDAANLLNDPQGPAPVVNPAEPRKAD